MYMLYRYIRANPKALVRVREHDRVPAYQLLLGYYDDDFVYIRPQIILPLFHAGNGNSAKFDERKIMEQLFALDMIKVHWIVTSECRYRPQKRVGKTRKRYITFYRNKLNAYLLEMDRRDKQ